MPLCKTSCTGDACCPGFSSFLSIPSRSPHHSSTTTTRSVSPARRHASYSLPLTLPTLSLFHFPLLFPGMEAGCPWPTAPPFFVSRCPGAPALCVSPLSHDAGRHPCQCPTAALAAGVSPLAHSTRRHCQCLIDVPTLTTSPHRCPCCRCLSSLS